jgi:hypothetical protein
MATRVERLRRIKRLEGRTSTFAASVAQLEAIRRERLLSAALALLADEDVRILGVVVERASEAVEGGDGGPVDLYRYADGERDRRALKRFEQALVEIAMGDELPRGASDA